MRILTAAVLCVGISGPALATTFIDGTVNASSSVDLGVVTDYGLTTGPASTAAPASIGSSGIATTANSVYSATSYAGVRANWASADAGSISMDWGWQLASGGSPLATGANTNLQIPNWSYTFTATGNGVFSGTYNVSGTGDLFGLQPIYGTGDMPFGPYGGTVQDLTGSGSFAVSLVNGQTYTMAFFNFGNIHYDGGVDSTAAALAAIDWTISYDAVPEPASWAMMITGFGLVGAGMRRRRMVAA